MTKLKSVRWIGTQGGTIGIVIVEDEHEGEKAYINVVPGFDQASDVQRVMDYGSTFPISVAQQLM